MKYTVWSQSFDKNGRINEEDMIAEFNTLEEAVRFAHPGTVIRCSEHYTGEGDFWEAIEEATGAFDDFTEYDEEGNKI